MGKAGAQIEISAGTSRLAAGLKRAASQFASFGAGIARGIGGALKKINWQPGDMMRGAMAHAGGDLIGKGISSITDAADEVRTFERSLVRYRIATDGSAASATEMRKRVEGISEATGVARAEVLAGAQAYVGFTGDAKGASQAAEVFARVAAASGASTAEVAQAQAALKTSMGITANDAEAAFSALIVQGKGGAVEIKDMAAQMASLAPQFALFKNGKGLAGLREMGAGFQVVMKNSSDAADASTKYSALMGSLGDPRTLKALKGMGIAVTDNKGKLLDATTVFHNLAKSKKLFEKTNLSGAFGRKEARLAVLALKEHIGEYDELRAAAEDTGAVQRDMNTYLESDAGRLDKAMNSLKLTIAETFTPERIAAFTSAVESMVEKLKPAVSLLGKAGDILGGIYDVGKNIRGVFGDMGGRGGFDIARDRALVDRAEKKNPFTGKNAYNVDPNELARAKSRLAGDEASAGARARILAAEKNDRSSKESIREAVLAKYTGRNKETGGGIEEQNAGERYLRAAGLDQEKIDQVVQGILKDTATQLAQGIRDGFAGVATQLPAPVLKLGDNQVATSESKATNARRATR